LSIDSSNPITSEVFAIDIEGWNDNGCNIVNGTNGDKICDDMVVVGRRMDQVTVSSFEDHVFQRLQSL